MQWICKSLFLNRLNWVSLYKKTIPVETVLKAAVEQAETGSPTESVCVWVVQGCDHNI